MKNHLLPVFAILLISILCSTCISDPTASDTPVDDGSLSSADALYEKNDFQKALEAYEKVFSEAQNQGVKTRAFFRMCESLTHLFRYGKAGQLVLDTPLPENNIDKARTLLFKAEMLRQFLQQYQTVLGQERVENGESQAIFKMTKAQIDDIIDKSYATLLEMKDVLLSMPLAEQSYYFWVKGVDVDSFPTMFDFFIFSWSKYLVPKRAVSKNDLELLIAENFNPPSDSTGLLRAAGLMETASKIQAGRFPQASEMWKIRRLILAFSSQWDQKAQEQSLSARNAARNILAGFMKTFSTPQAKAEAGFQAALLDNQIGEFVRGRELCEAVIHEIPATTGAKKAEVLRIQITNPSISMTVRNMTPETQNTIMIYARNLPCVYFRAFKLDEEQLKLLEQQPRRVTELFSYYNSEGIKAGIIQGKPDLEWTVLTNDDGRHATRSITVTPPHLALGIYVIESCNESSFDEGTTLFSSGVVNVSNFMLLTSPGPTTKTLNAYFNMLDKGGQRTTTDTLFRSYAVDVKTGKLVPGVSVSLDWQENYGANRVAKTTTDLFGRAGFESSLRLHDEYNQYVAMLFAKRGSSYSYPQQQIYMGHVMPDPVEIFMYTDRPIYRPGDKVMVKITAVRRIPDGFRPVDAGTPVRFWAKDTNGNMLFEKTVPVNESGSVSVEFSVPAGRLLGIYSLDAQVSKGIFTGRAYDTFRVEEYKRPEFEVTFQPSAGESRFANPAELKGSVLYYFGGPAANAPVFYTISRSTYVPWQYRYWFYGESAFPSTEIANGELVTDEKGSFTIKFTPSENDIQLPAWLRNGKVPEIANYTITVNARDSGGRTITATTTRKAGRNNHYYVIEPGEEFFQDNESIVISSKRFTVNDEPEAGEATYEVFQLKNPPLKTWEELGYGATGSGNTVQSLPGPDYQLRDAENGARVAQGPLVHDAQGKAGVTLSGLTAGAYRIIVTGKSPGPGLPGAVQQKIFLVASSATNSLPVNVTAITAVKKSQYAVGETAKILLGSGFTSGQYIAEIWAGQYFIKNIFIDSDKPVQVVDVMVTADMKGGFTVRWFGVKDIAVYYGSASVQVPWSEKTLTLGLDPFSKQLAPGEKASWGITAKDNQGKSVDAEALVFMYDRSLEYYATQSGMGFSSLYLPNPHPAYTWHSAFSPWVRTYQLKSGLLYDRIYKNRMPQEILPGVYAAQTWFYGYKDYDLNKMTLGDMELKERDLPSAAPATVSEQGFNGRTRGADRSELVSDATTALPQQAQGAPEARKAFADTAFFLPHVKIIGGKALFDFTAPEQLTGWRIKAIALSPSAQYGILDSETVTKKDLMVRLDLPRFFREKDKGTITMMVHNESDKVMVGTARINVLENNTSIAASIKLTGLEKNFTIQPHSLQSFDWSVEIPAGTATYTVHADAMATSGDTAQAATFSSLRFTDAEERSLPILPSRERLMESAFQVMKGPGTFNISIPAKSDPTRITESAVLKVDPQLALTILNSLPFLIDYPHPCVEQTLNRYVPLALVSALYAKFPEVKAVVDKLPRRDTVTPPWDKDNPERVMQIQETPWGWESGGRPSSWYPVIDLLDPAIVAAYKENTLGKLISFQKSSGGFPWMPGGQEDIYMTLYVLDGLAQVKRYGGEIKADMINSALRFINTEIPKNFKPEPYYAALVSYAAYVVTSFPTNEFSEAAKALEQAKSWVRFIETNLHSLTPLGKAYLASIYFGLGDKKKGDELLETIMSSSQIDPVAGLYWTPEEYSWVWYSDTVEKHAFIMRLLMKQHPDDPRIDAMAQWLLFNRIGNVWKSTKASAAAIFCLLEYMKSGGALLADETITVSWGEEKQTVRVAGDSWQKEPLRFERPAAPAIKDSLLATVEKQGAGTSFASMVWTYTTDQLPEASGPGLVTISRTFFVREKQGESYVLRQIRSNDTVKVGDQIEVKLTVRTKSQFEYMHLRDPKAAGFEAETLTSGWKYSPLWFYEEPRDSGTNFFFNWLPHGEYVLSYRLRPTKPGEYRIGAATLQSMYAPELTAHSDGFIVKVVK